MSENPQVHPSKDQLFQFKKAIEETMRAGISEVQLIREVRAATLLFKAGFTVRKPEKGENVKHISTKSRVPPEIRESALKVQRILDGVE